MLATQMRRASLAALLWLLPLAVLAQHHGASFGKGPQISPCEKVYSDPDLISDLVKASTSFQISTSKPEARDFFRQGFTLLTGLNYEDAMRSFRKAAKLDDSFAMAHWGAALAVGPNINIGMDSTCAKVGKSESEAAWNMAKVQLPKRQITQKEYDLIEALLPRYNGSLNNEAGYALAMKKVAEKYPEDAYVGGLYAEALMDLRPWGLYDRSGRPVSGTLEIISVLTEAIKNDPNSTGGNHFYIHAVESSPGLAPDPVQAKKSADLLRTLVPSSGHLVHMPSHIYMRLGDYRSAVKSNQDAEKIDDDLYGRFCQGSYEKYVNEPRCLPNYFGHYQSHNLKFLSVANGFLGKGNDSLAAARKTASHALRFLPNDPALQHYLTAPLLVLVNHHQWDEVLKETVPKECAAQQDGCHLIRAVWHWAQGMANAAKDQPDVAENYDYPRFLAERGAIRFLPWGNNTPESLLKIADQLLRARIASARQRPDVAIEHLSIAMTLEDDLIYDEPPPWFYPLRDALGGALLQARLYSGAAGLFEEDLRRNPGNGRSLFGLAESLKTLKDPQWERYDKMYREAWKEADRPLTVSDLW